MIKILVADDDNEIRDLLEFDISQSGYEVECAKDGMDALEKAVTGSFDVILLDVMMPKMNGFEVCKNIRKSGYKTPILLLTAKGTIGDKTQGFGCGADDYMVKPFEIQEVLLRIEALLRRSQENKTENKEQEVLKVGDIEIVPESLEAIIKGTIYKLTPIEFDILYSLMQHFNKPVTLATLLDEVWGYESDEDVRMLRVHVGGLRAKIEKDSRNPVYLHTVTNVGYKLTPIISEET